MEQKQHSLEIFIEATSEGYEVFADPEFYECLGVIRYNQHYGKIIFETVAEGGLDEENMAKVLGYMAKLRERGYKGA